MFHIILREFLYKENGQIAGIVSDVSSRETRLGEWDLTLSVLYSENMSHYNPAIDRKTIIWGVPKEKKPFRGTILGNVRIRYRNESAATVTIRDPYFIRQFYLVDKGDYVTHGVEIAQTQRSNSRHSS